MIDGIPNRPLYFYQKDIIAAPFLEHLHVDTNLGYHVLIPPSGDSVTLMSRGSWPRPYHIDPRHRGSKFLTRTGREWHGTKVDARCGVSSCITVESTAHLSFWSAKILVRLGPFPYLSYFSARTLARKTISWGSARSVARKSWLVDASTKKIRVKSSGGLELPAVFLNHQKDPVFHLTMGFRISIQTSFNLFLVFHLQVYSHLFLPKCFPDHPIHFFLGRQRQRPQRPPECPPGFDSELKLQETGMVNKKPAGAPNVAIRRYPAW